MSEDEPLGPSGPGEGLGPGPGGLRARGPGRTAAQEEAVLGSTHLAEGEEEDAVSRLRALLDRDMLACDVQLSLFVAAATSYRQDSALRPFPPALLLPGGERDLAGLAAAIASLPSLAEVRAGLDRPGGVPARLVSLLVWVLGTAGLGLRTLGRQEADRVLALPGPQAGHPRPHSVMEVTLVGRRAARWERAREHPCLWAFHGSRLDNFHSILHFGLQQHRTKVSLFGEGIYLSRDLGVCLTYSHRGAAWQRSALGGAVSAVALAEVEDHPTQVKLASSVDRARGEVEGSEGGRVPDMYVVVRNDELLRVKYLLIYRHETSRLARLGGGRLLAWLARHKLVVLLLAYAAMLAAIGLANSRWARRWLRRQGWTD